MNSLRLKQGSIIIGNLPFTDLSQIKRRPLLITSNNEYNYYSDDVICIKVTSEVKDRPYTVRLTKHDLENGTLKKDSSIKVDSIISIRKNLLSEPVAMVKKELLASVKENLKLLFSI